MLERLKETKIKQLIDLFDQTIESFSVGTEMS